MLAGHAPSKVAKEGSVPDLASLLASGNSLACGSRTPAFIGYSLCVFVSVSKHPGLGKDNVRLRLGPALMTSF